MKSSLLILLLFVGFACSAQTDSAYYRKVDVQPVFKGKGSIYNSHELADCIIANGSDSSAYKQCIAEMVVGIDGKTSNIKLITDLPECYQKVALKTAQYMVFKPAILNSKPVPALTKVAFDLATR